MPTYLFRAEDGQLYERIYPMGEAPKIGSTIKAHGRMYRRIFCGRIDVDGIARKTWGYPFASESLPRNIDFGCDRDQKGRQFIKSQAQERDVLARASAYSRRIGEGDWERD